VWGTREQPPLRHEGSDDMNENAPQLQEPTVALPANAPLVRITAGIGSAGQKTWNLRRPVTLIGSSRPAHIVLHDKDIAKAHCVIVNTGTEVLIKDLRTSAGTLCNRNPIDLSVLADGDVVTIGSNNIQVAINLPEGAPDDSSAGLEFVDPVKFPEPLDVRLIHTEQQWKIEDAVVLIGRHELAAIRLDHEDVSTRHAVLFRYGERPAVFDLGCRTGIWVNGKRSSIATLSDGDCVTVGPFGLSIGSPDLAALRGTTPVPPAMDPILHAVLPGARVGSAVEKTFPSAESNGQAAPSEVEPSLDDWVQASDRTNPAGQEGDELVSEIGDTWQNLNKWGTDATHASAAPQNEAAEALAARTAELDARDAALRGQLHDVSRMHEQLVEEEKKIAKLRAEMERAQLDLEQRQARLTEAEADLEKRLADVQSRENALAQRWSRIRSATCSHCGKPSNLAQPPAA
jgi:pSer/pThr/pTyr-binding forkhead associated (FHA) protein